MLDIEKRLLQCGNLKFTARIPLPTSLRSATFPPGEGIGAVSAIASSNRATNCNLFFQYNKLPALLQPFLDAKTIDIFSRWAYTECIRIKFPIKRGKSMEMVLLTALGVGGATVFGSLIGFLFKNISHKFSDIVLSFAAGVMLAAAVIGLILPSLEHGGKGGLPDL